MLRVLSVACAAALLSSHAAHATVFFSFVQESGVINDPNGTVGAKAKVVIGFAESALRTGYHLDIDIPSAGLKSDYGALKVLDFSIPGVQGSISLADVRSWSTSASAACYSTDPDPFNCYDPGGGHTYLQVDWSGGHSIPSFFGSGTTPLPPLIFSPRV